LRIEEMRLLGVGPFTFADTGDLLLLQLGSGQPEAIQSAAIAAVGRYNDPRVAPALIQRWRIFTPRLRHDALAALLSRNDRSEAVLAALESGRITGGEFSLLQVDFLRTHRDPAISRRALQLFGPVPRQRPEAVKRFKPALGLKGAADRGRGIFLTRCATCHIAERTSQAPGPELVSAKIYGKEKALAAILEPNVDVRRDYLTYVVETMEGMVLIGLLRNENAVAITVQQPNGVAVVLPRANIRYGQAQPWSLMPEGIEEGLTPQDMADLLGYILRLIATP
jgi:putative heme-binding domain-containing protein